MPRALQDLTQDVIQLPREERLALARILLDLDDPGIDTNVESIWDQEIKDRIKAYDEGRVQAVPYDEVKSKMQSRFA